MAENSNGIVLKFNKYFFVINAIDSFAKINKYTNNMVFLLQLINYLIYRVIYCMCSGMVFSKAIFFVVHHSFRREETVQPVIYYLFKYLAKIGKTEIGR